MVMTQGLKGFITSTAGTLPPPCYACRAPVLTNASYQVSVCGDDGLVTGEYPTMTSAAEGDHGIFVNHAAIGREDPAPLLFTKHSSSRGGDP